jgi:MFS family permease
MPRVRRLPPARLSAPLDSVRVSALALTGAVAVDDGTIRFPSAGSGVGDLGVDLLLTRAADETTDVAAVGHGRLEIPFFRWAFRPLVAIAQRRTARWVLGRLRADLEGAPRPAAPKPVFGLPTATFTPAQAAFLATASAAVAVVVFASALVGQVDGPIAKTFHTSNASLGAWLAVTRIGALLALAGIALADRQGRRRSILIGLVGSAVACALSAMAPSMGLFIAAQVFQRGFLIMTATVASVAVVEEAPEGARAYATSMLALAGGFGFSFSVITLPFSDIGPQAWRIPFVLGALSIFLAPPIARRLKETTRYEALAERVDIKRGRVREIRSRGYARRFVLLAAIAFLLNVFNAPSSVFMNKYLTDVHQFSNSGIALFRTITTGIPGLLGLVIGGRLAEARGRRPIAVIALAIGTATQMVFFLAGGTVIWLMAAVSILAAGAGGIALGTLDAELFPTEFRSTSNGLLGVIAVIGSAIGLVASGAMAHPKAELGRAVAICGIAALFAALALVPLLPESVSQRLDDVSPIDALPPDDYRPPA